MTREKKQLFPTELGIMITDMMKEYFSDIVDIAFTAEMEERLDEVEEGRVNWRDVVADFYGPFEKTLENAEAKIEKVEMKDEVSDVVCDKCGAKMVYKLGRYGGSWPARISPTAATRRPFRWRSRRPALNAAESFCRRCPARGRKFYGCEHYPECDFVSWEMPVKEKCPQCGSYMTLSRSKKGDFHVCANEACRTRVPVQDSGEEEAL